MKDDVQYQPRTETITDLDILHELLELVNFNALSKEQRIIIEMI